MKAFRIALALCLAMGVGVPSMSVTAADPTATVLEGCKEETETYCNSVEPGEGRLLACFYAHGDKLSGKCDYALHDAAAQLERAVAALNYVASECADDIESMCSNVARGEGRVASCLKSNESKLSERCLAAAKEVGLKQ